MQSRSDRFYPIAMLTPFFILVCVFYCIPLILTVLMAFTDMDHTMSWHFVGFETFRHVVQYPFLKDIIFNTLIYVSITLVLTVGFGFLVSLLTVFFMEDSIHSRFVRTIWMLPRITPGIVLIIMWAWFFSSTEFGFLNQCMLFFGKEPIRWLSEHAMAAIIIVNTFSGISFTMLILTSAMQSLPSDIFLAADVDGAKKLTIVTALIIPGIKWPLMFISVVQLLGLFTSYELIMLLTNGGPLIDTTVWALHAYKKAFNYSDFGNGAALSLIIVSVSFILTLILLRFFNFDEMMKNTRL